MEGFEGGLGFGLLQPGGAYAGPVAQAQARDPRYAYARALISKGLEDTPIISPLQGFARMANAGVGALMENRLQSQYDDRNKAYTAAMADALKAGLGSPGQAQTYANLSGDDNGLPQTANFGAVAPDANRSMQILSANADTAPLAMQMLQHNQQAALAARNAITQQYAGSGLVPTFDASGNVTGTQAIPGYAQNVGGTQGGIAQAAAPGQASAIQIQTPAKALEAGAVANAQVPAQVSAHQQMGTFDTSQAGPRAAAVLGAQNTPVPVTLPGSTTPTQLPAAAVAPASAHVVGAQATQAATQPNQNTTTEGKMADDFRSEPAVKSYKEVVPIWNSMVDASKNTSRASDLNLVYGLAKIMDPNSVVREGEMIMVNNTAALPDQLLGMINRLNGGQALQPDTRNAIMQEAGSRAGQYQAQYEATAQQFKETAARRGLNPANIVVHPGDRSPFTPAGAGDPLENEMRRRGLLK